MPTADGEHRRRRDKYDREDRPSPRSKTSYRSPTRTTSLDYGSRTSSSPRKSYLPASSAMPIPELKRRTSSGSAINPRGSIPYPTFSKAHSREAVRSAESVVPKIITPEATDLGHGSEGTGSPKPRPHGRASPEAPPSPPLSAMEEGIGRSKSAASLGHSTGSPRTGGSNGSRTKDEEGLRFSASRSSLRQAEEGLKPAQGHERARSNLTPGSSPSRKAPSSRHVSGSAESDTTTVPGKARPHSYVRVNKSGLSSENGSNATSIDTRRTAPIEIFTYVESDSDAGTAVTPISTSAQSPALPPPPQPYSPTVVHQQAPKVDYLLENGGLARPVTKSFASILNPPLAAGQQRFTSPLLQPKPDYSRACFGPFHAYLDDFIGVMNKNGSIAVATGHRSVTRKLVDRLEQTFGRNLASSTCTCVICQALQTPTGNSTTNWIDVLELLSGRTPLPQWPPFTLLTTEADLGPTKIDIEAPMQRLDVDVPDEYREHYIRQSKKTKVAVQNWLACQPEDHASPPSSVDDETLVFAMVTHLAQDQRSTFMALMRGLSTLPPSRAPTPVVQPQDANPTFIPQTSIALQRLYHLPKPPRDPETALFLLKNPSLHNTLATLSSLTKNEWDTLISGRFDTDTTSTPAASTRSSTNPDAETEMRTLADVEMQIYTGMEALEDAFEALHAKAETVRRALRERGAGLAAAARAEALDAKLGISASVGRMCGDAVGTIEESENEQDGRRRMRNVDVDDSTSDVVSELAPDDSASNIGFVERHRRRRREEGGGRSRDGGGVGGRDGGGGGVGAGGREEYSSGGGGGRRRHGRRRTDVVLEEDED